MPKTFLCDVHIFPRLVALLRAEGFEAFHVFDVGLGSADDTAIWKYALDHDAIIVTKDKDFVRLDVSQPGPRVILVCTGNSSNQWLIARFTARLAQVLAHFDSGKRLVELR